VKSPNPRWYVVQTQPNGEARAVAHLEKQGFEVYAPRYLKTTRHARRFGIVKAPLFPRYIFVRIDVNAQQWRVINSTFGVSQLVGHRGIPVAVTPGVVETLRLGQSADGFFKLLSIAARFRAGDAVRIRSGAFDDCLGIFEARTDSERVAILLDLLGRKVRIVLGVQAIEAA
jgi:transcriptional antiterminator RfaH